MYKYVQTTQSNIQTLAEINIYVLKCTLVPVLAPCKRAGGGYALFPESLFTRAGLGLAPWRCRPALRNTALAYKVKGNPGSFLFMRSGNVG